MDPHEEYITRSVINRRKKRRSNEIIGHVKVRLDDDGDFDCKMPSPLGSPSQSFNKRRRSSTISITTTAYSDHVAADIICSSSTHTGHIQKHSNRIIERILLLVPLLFSVAWRLFRFPGPLLIWAFTSMYWAPGDIYAWCMPVLYVLTLDVSNRMAVWTNLCLSWTSLSGASYTSNQFANCILYYVTVVAGTAAASPSPTLLRYSSSKSRLYHLRSGPFVLPIELYNTVGSVLTTLCGQSLSTTEIRLFSQLFCNLVLYDASSGLDSGNPALHYSRAIVLAASFAMLCCSGYIDRIVSISKIVGAHKRPANADATKLTLARKCLVLFLASGLVAFNLFTDPLAKISTTASGTSLSTGTASSTASAASSSSSSTSIDKSPRSWLFSTTYLSQLITYIIIGSDQPRSRDFWSWIASTHIPIIVYWSVLLLTIGIFVFQWTKNWRLDLRRKAWHLCVVALFVPPLVANRVSSHFIGLCLSAILVVFIALEVLRAANIPPYGMAIHSALCPFTDTRDTSGPIIVSHIYLLLGISIPIWASGSILGLICLGLGDTASSIIGRKYGTRHKIFGDKSLQGTLAFVVAVSLGLFATSSSLQRAQPNFMAKVLTLSTAGALIEATSRVNDNLIVPAYIVCISQLL